MPTDQTPPLTESKYHPLFVHLKQAGGDRVVLSLQEIEALLGTRLPPSAHSQRAWWSNRSKGAVQARAWMEAGYHVAGVDWENGTVTFERPGLIYEVRRDGNTVLWNGRMVRALRLHMDWTQTELAEELGVRQQTVSEWETGLYEPRRSTSKHLSLVAEQVGFAYASQSEAPPPPADAPPA